MSNEVNEIEVQNVSSAKITSKLDLLFNMGVDVDQRTIYFFGDVDDDNYEVVIKAIHFLNNLSEDPIDMYICSDGGSVEYMFSLYDTIRSSIAPIRTILTGTVCSAAILIAICGKYRYATDTAYLMHHKGTALGSDLDEDELMGRAKVMEKWMSKMNELLAKHSKKNVTWWKTQAKGEMWLNAKDMLEHGIVDEILENPRLPAKKKSKKKKENGPK